MLLRYSLLIFLFLGIFACAEEPADPTIDCQSLIEGLEDRNGLAISTEIDFLAEDFVPVPSTADSIGHEANLEAFSRRLNAECGNVEVEIIGYANIQTNPPRSEVLLTVFNVDNTFERTIEINTPEDNVLSFGRIR